MYVQPCPFKSSKVKASFDFVAGRATTACVSPPRDWAVSSSHVQQNMVIHLARLLARTVFDVFPSEFYDRPGAESNGL